MIIIPSAQSLFSKTTENTRGFTLQWFSNKHSIVNFHHKYCGRGLHYKWLVSIQISIFTHCLKISGHIGIVYCLDSSPDALRIQLKSCLGDLTDSQLQNVVLEHLYQVLTGTVSEELIQYLEHTEDWANKVAACMYKLRGLANYSNQYKWSILESAYRRVMLVREYKPEFKLNSELVLISGNNLSVEGLFEDYNLSKYTNKPVKVFHIESDHATAFYDCRVSNIVNKMLDSKLLENFKKKNLCDKYFVKTN